jgi:hypothetical protein
MLVVVMVDARWFEPTTNGSRGLGQSDALSFIFSAGSPMRIYWASFRSGDMQDESTHPVHASTSGHHGRLQAVDIRHYAFWALITLLIICSGVASQGEGPVALPPGPLRPGAESGPTKVTVGIWLTDISKIDSVGQTFTANVVLIFRWHDPRLAHNEPGVKRYAVDDVWHPRWAVVNQSGSVDRSMPEAVTATPSGDALYQQRLVGSFAQALDLRRFPFDEDTFRIHLVIVGQRPEDIEFGPDPMGVAAGIPNGAGIAPEITLQDWRVKSFSTRVLPYRATPGLQVAGYAFEFVAARYSKHFIIKVIIPLVLIVMMSWAVFWVEPTDTGSQLGTAVTAMLTLIAYRFALDAEVPKLPYVTRLDAFVLFSTLLVFFSLIEVMATTKLAACERLGLARRIDLHSRWIFPAVFAVASALIFLG